MYGQDARSSTYQSINSPSTSTVPTYRPGGKNVVGVVLVLSRGRSGYCSARYSSPSYTRQVGQAPVLPGTPPQLASPPPRPRSQSCRCCCSLGLGTHRNHLDTPGNKSFLTCNRVGHYCRANRLISNLYSLSHSLSGHLGDGEAEEAVVVHRSVVGLEEQRLLVEEPLHLQMMLRVT